MNPWKIIGWIVLGGIVLSLGFCGLVLYQFGKANDPDNRARIAAAEVASQRRAAEVARNDPNICTIEKIEIVSLDAGFVDECRRTPCPAMKGVGVLRNNCAVATGVQLQITALDAGGRPVATRTSWPASVQNIPPGEYTFSVDTWFTYDPRIKSFRAQPVETHTW